MKKFLISALVLSSALAAPAFAFAQNNGPVTRAQVKAELIQLEKAGYTRRAVKTSTIRRTSRPPSNA